MVLKKGQKYLIYILAVFLIIVPSVSAIDTLPSSVEIPSIKLPTDHSKMSVQPSIISNAPPLPVATQLTIQKPSIVTAPVNPILSESSSPNMTDLNIMNDTFDSVSEPSVGWKFRGNLANTGEYDDGGIRPNGKKRWEYDAGAGISSSPSYTNGVLYIGGDLGGSNNLHALDMGTGKKIWDFKTPGDVTTSPAIFNGLVYFGNHHPAYPFEGPSFYALDAISGNKKWEFKPDAGVFSNPTVYNGYVYFGIDRKVLCLNAKTGDLRWVFPMGSHSSSPALSNGTLYIADEDNLYAINSQTGDQKWTYNVGGVYGSPSVSGEIVYISSCYFNNHGKILALNSFSGQKIWENKIGSFSTPAISNGMVFLGSSDKKVYALDAKTGSKIWDFKTGGKVYSSPAVANGVVYVGSDDRVLYALDAKTGKQLWAFLTGGSIKSSPAVVNGVVYFGCTDDKVYAIGTGNSPIPDTASLSITSSPSKASIYIDESNTGKKTPATISGLTAGEHQVLIKKTGYSDFNQTVNLTLGKTTKLKAKLNRICTLVINSKPSGASVWIDNSSTEKVTPFVDTALTPGSHEVKLEKEGYNTFYKKVILKSGKKVTLSAKLTSKK